MPILAEPALVQALTEVLAAYGPEGADSVASREVGAKLAKRKDLKVAFTPIAKLFKYGVSREFVMQFCLEQPADSPLRAAATALITQGTVTFPVWTSISAAEGPKRKVKSLQRSVHEPVFYAIESDPRISVWSWETGAHIADLKLPGNSDAEGWNLVELPDGRLRCLTNQGVIAERAPGGATFVKKLTAGKLNYGWAGKPDLSRFVSQPGFDPIKKDDGDWQRLMVHDSEKGTSTEVLVPFSYTESVWNFIAPNRVALMGRRTVTDAAGELADESSLAVIDLDTATARMIRLERVPQSIFEIPNANSVGMKFVREENGKWVEELAAFDLDTGASSDFPRIDDYRYTIPMGDGHHEYDEQSYGTLLEDQKPIGKYQIPESHYRVCGAFDPKTGSIALAALDPATPVYVIARFDLSRVVSAPVKVETKPLSWARPGAVLHFEIADFDAEDEWSFEVVDAGEDLVLRAKMDEDVVAEAMRFTAAALASGSEFVAFAQGGADVDVAKPQSKKLPPFLLGRAGFEKLAAGKKVAYKSEWSEKTSLESGGRGNASVPVNEVDQAVAVIRASGENVSLVILDDPTWPLLIDRSEGDCFVRLKRVDLSRATERTAPTSAPEPAPVKATNTSTPAAASSAARSFEFTEDGSSKFWEIALSGTALTVRFGKIGTSGQTQTKSFASDEAAQKEHEKLVREKTKKGYREVAK